MSIEKKKQRIHTGPRLRCADLVTLNPKLLNDQEIAQGVGIGVTAQGMIVRVPIASCMMVMEARCRPVINGKRLSKMTRVIGFAGMGFTDEITFFITREFLMRLRDVDGADLEIENNHVANWSTMQRRLKAAAVKVPTRLEIIKDPKMPTSNDYKALDSFLDRIVDKREARREQADEVAEATTTMRGHELVDQIMSLITLTKALDLSDDRVREDLDSLLRKAGV